MLIAAHAGAIPLADDSVQCVVTSPPYWGLRKYAGDQELVWGGDATKCAHEWASVQPARRRSEDWARGDKQRSCEGSEYPSQPTNHCLKCGAWRGAYGLEPTVEMYVAHTVEILREVRRVLRADGVCFLNLGDSYAGSGAGGGGNRKGNEHGQHDSMRGLRPSGYGGRNPNQSLLSSRARSCGNDGRGFRDWQESGCACPCHDDERSNVSSHHTAGTRQQRPQGGAPASWKDRDSEPLDSSQVLGDGVPPDAQVSNRRVSSQSSQASRVVRFCSGCLSFHRSAYEASESGTLYHVPKPKDLCLIPMRVAIAAQNDGWWVRSAIIWQKPNPMPESVTDRPTDAYEHILMLTKSSRYYWDAEAVKEAQTGTSHARGSGNNGGPKQLHRENVEGVYKGWYASTLQVELPGGRNLRNVWTFATQPYSGAHFATFPEELPRRCIRAATSERGACRFCRTPWERVTRKGNTMPESWHSNPMDTGKTAEGNRMQVRTGTAYETGTNANRIALLRQQARENGGEYINESQTIGWRPGCGCRGQHGRTVPCRVLDPFGGSGTTGRVAVELNREAVLLDLAYSGSGYEELADTRTRNVQRQLI